ncbi:MAG: TIGR01777 family oxidoreductase [Phycisphaerales bacterium]
MSRFTRSSPMPASRADLAHWHMREGALQRMLPPWEDVDVVQAPVPMVDGAIAEFVLHKGLLPLRWVARHEQVDPATGFVDLQVRGPFRRWRHQHRFEERGATSAITDDIQYELPLPPLGSIVGGWMVRGALERAFRFRHRRLANDLQRHRECAALAGMCVGITGASGLVGRQLQAFLTTGGTSVKRLTRGSASASRGEIQWNPGGERVATAPFGSLDAVVHLAGANLADERWTPQRKAVLRDSRVAATRHLCELLAGLERKPRVLVSMSGIGYYGTEHGRTVDERDGAGEDFIAALARDWEDATRPAVEAGIRVVLLRAGMVVTAAGGAVAKMRTPFLFGAGGPVGSGRQGISWIAADDLLGMIATAIVDERWSGPVNAVAPESVEQRAFARALGRSLRRPAFAPLPAAVVRMMFGEMGESLLLRGQFARPSRALELGFRYDFGQIQDALDFELGRA